MHKRASLAPAVQHHLTLVRELERTGDAAGAEKTREALMKLLQEKGISGSPLQGFGYAFCVQMPGFLCMFAAVRGMATHPMAYRDFVADAASWVTSPALPDPLGVFPVSSALAILANAELQMRYNQNLDPYMLYVVRGAVLLFVPLTMQMPSGMIAWIFANTVTESAYQIQTRMLPSILDFGTFEFGKFAIKP